MPSRDYIYEDVEMLAGGDIMTLRIYGTPRYLNQGKVALQVYEWDIDGECRPYNLLIQGLLDARGLRNLANSALCIAARIEARNLCGVEEDEPLALPSNRPDWLEEDNEEDRPLRTVPARNDTSCDVG